VTRRSLVPAAIVATVTVAASAAPALAHAARLSNETTFTRWTHAATYAKVHARPSRRARQVGRLRLLTEDGFPEVYVVLSDRRVRGVDWARLRLPQRPNGVTGWVRRSTLGPFNMVHTQLVANRSTLRITLYDHGRRRLRFPIGMGAPGTPTPTGSFWIREKFHVNGGTLYGPRAMGTAAYSDVLTDWPGGGVIGIHGTDQPWLIPGRPSHGCMRMHNGDITRLYRHTPIGTPLLIK